MHCFLDGKKSYVLCKNNIVRKIVNDELSKTLFRILPYRAVCLDEQNSFIVSGVTLWQILQCCVCCVVFCCVVLCAALSVYFTVLGFMYVVLCSAKF